MPRLNCTYGQFVEIILTQGFVCIRHDGTSHRRYRGVVDGQVRLVDCAGHRDNDRPKPKTLSSMVRQSGLPKALFMR